jgi:hypothetical protein
MASETNVTGRWVGAYYQYDRPHAITLEIVQEGETLTGSMSDGEPESSLTVEQFATLAGLPLGGDEQIVSRLRENFPDAPAGQVYYISQLAPESTVEGWVRDRSVYFLKRYAGESFGGFKIGEMVVGQRVPAHSVHYSGKLSTAGTQIEGNWWIEGDAESGARRAEGSFLVRR